MELVPDDIFGEDYLPFYGGFLEERADAEAELICRLAALQPGQRLLDAPCGHGRIAVRLAERGCRVTGLDRSPHFLARAREAAAERDVKLDLHEGDLRALPFEGGFDVALNWFTSFGYFDDVGNLELLRGYRRSLEPGGLLLLEMFSREFVVSLTRTAGQSVNIVEQGDDLMIDRVTFDVAAGRTRTERIVVRDGRVRRSSFSLRVPTLSELASWLRAAGFEQIDAYDETGAAYTTASRRLIVTAR